jgi:hypothetical protein
MTLTSEALLAGSALTHEVEVPPYLLAANNSTQAATKVVLRALTVRDLQRIAKAVRNDEGLSTAFIIQQGLVQPELGMDEVTGMPAGLARFLVEQINSISGVNTPRDALQEYVQAPLAKACFVLAREFGWTPEQVSGMTIGQILLYLEMANRGEEGS